jgi:molecular chaperone HscB
MQNHFDLFQLPVQFALDLSALDSAFREVQGQVHPDKFVQASAAEQRVAMQWATRANEAYQTLKNPLQRARYLCELHGQDLQVESNTAMPMPFLMQQMEWREALADARQGQDEAALEQLDAMLHSSRNELLQTIGRKLDAQDFAAAASEVRCLMFVTKFGEEVAHALDALHD